MSAWEDGWIYTEDRLPPLPKNPSRPMVITFEGRTGKRKSSIGIYMGNGRWKMRQGETSYRVIACMPLPKPAINKFPKFLKSIDR